jgi:molybdopterin-guanine dinucleotide biosynthesis protein A
LAGKPLIRHVTDVVYDIVDETIIVVSSEVQAENFARVLGSDIHIAVDADDTRSPLIGALTGFEKASGQYSLLLPCDTPLLSRDVLLLLLKSCRNKNAVVPRWPNGYIEPLQAVYRIRPALETAKNALNRKKTDMRSMVSGLQGVRYISTLILKQLDPESRTFFNVNTPLDFKKAEALLTSKKNSSTI